MSFNLLVVESPAKAKTIEKYLKDLGDFKVVASIGHIRDLPKSNKDAVDIPAGFIPKYVISDTKKKVISNIGLLAKRADTIYLATDPDREGEAISWHLQEILSEKSGPYKISKDKFKRVTFNEITKDAVTEAVKNPRKIDDDLRQAQEARRVLDRLVGYDLSGLIWKKVRYGLSAGRVQSPALRIIMEREREIRSFIPETFWTISAELSKEKNSFIAVCKDEPRDKAEVDRILDIAKKESWLVKDIKESEAKRSPYAPFITSTLQQTASTRLGYAPSRTMGIAQKLYEGGHITYMRTDSTSLSKQALAQAAKVIEKEFGASEVQIRTYAKKSKNAQEAHEAIRPTDLSKKSVGNNGAERELYELIWKRTISSQMKDATLMRTKLTANVKSDSIPDFSINGQRVIKLGWLVADSGARSADTEVPKLQIGDALDLIKITDEEKATQPKPRYTEAGLIKELEKRGIGRPSTYASIIRTIEERGYVEKEGRTLIPTDTGDVVSTFLEENFEKYIGDDFTAEMENELDEIANGERNYTKTLSDFYIPFSKDVEAKQEIAKLTTLGTADAKHICPKCKSGMDIKLGRSGKFLSCSKYPDCDGALTIDGKEMGGEQSMGTHPTENLPIYVMNGKFGPYVQLGTNPKKGEKDPITKKALPKPKRASIPKEIVPEEMTMDQAVHLLILPRTLGEHPEIKEPVITNIGKFGPYVGCDGDFRSLKDVSPYDVTLEQALTLLAQPKTPPRGAEIVKELGKHPKTKKPIVLYKSKSGLFLKKGLKRIYLPDNTDIEKMTVETATDILKSS